jgi:hypothetical protein
MEKLPGNVISMSDYLERKAGPTTEDITKRLAEIAPAITTRPERAKSQLGLYRIKVLTNYTQFVLY